MSENLLQLIPQQPDFVPDEKAVLLAKQFLASQVSESSEVDFEVSEDIRFIAAGANFESISCPVCGKRVSIEWWSAAMDVAHKTQFSNLDIVVPCCESQTTLNHLNYNFPQGFARFVLAVRNPGISELTEQSKDELERIVGCKLRVIWSHY
jgi:hypothetical protein